MWVWFLFDVAAGIRNYAFFQFFIIAGPQLLEGDVLLKDAQGSCFATDLSLSILKQIDYISLSVITYTIEKGNI